MANGENHPAISLKQGTRHGAAKSVTLVISHLLDPQHSQRYEEWLGKIMPIAAEFPGHLGANVIPARRRAESVERHNPLRYPGAPLRLDAVGNPSATGG